MGHVGCWWKPEETVDAPSLNMDLQLQDSSTFQLTSIQVYRSHVNTFIYSRCKAIFLSNQCEAVFGQHVNSLLSVFIVLHFLQRYAQWTQSLISYALSELCGVMNFSCA